MNKLQLFLSFLLSFFFLTPIRCAKIIILNRTGKDIRIKARAQGIGDSDATRENVLSNDAYILPSADIQYTIAWSYVSVANWKRILRGSQYNGRDISLVSNDDYLIIITGHGKSCKYKSNYLEILLTKDDATRYVEAITKINQIRNLLNQAHQTYEERYTKSLSLGEWVIDKTIGKEDAPFNFFLETSFIQNRGEEIQDLLGQLETWAREIQELKIILEHPLNTFRLYCYGEETLIKIKSMLEKIARFFEKKDDTLPSARVLHTARVEILRSENHQTQEEALNQPIAQETTPSSDIEDEQANLDAQALLHKLGNLTQEEQQEGF